MIVEIKAKIFDILLEIENLQIKISELVKQKDVFLKQLDEEKKK